MHYLERHQGSSEYLVAVNGSQTAAPFILESGKAVIAMGGFGGTDPAPTLSQFEQLVATGKVHYVYVSSGGAAGGGRRRSSAPAHRRWRPDDDHSQCSRQLGREARDRGLVERLRRQLGQRNLVLRQQLGGTK